MDREQMNGPVRTMSMGQTWKRIRTVNDLEVYRKAMDVSMQIFRLSRGFPNEERYSLTDQIRRSSRSVFANLAEGWSKRMYVSAFKLKLMDAVSEAVETQTWLEYCYRCDYLSRDECVTLYNTYGEIIRILGSMYSHPEKWILPKT